MCIHKLYIVLRKKAKTSSFYYDLNDPNRNWKFLFSIKDSSEVL